MKKNSKISSVIAAALAAGMLAGCSQINGTAAYDSAEASQTLKMFAVTDCVARESASDESAPVYAISRGEAVEVAAARDSGFYEIKGGGYIHSEYLGDAPADDTGTYAVTTAVTSEYTQDGETTAQTTEPKPSSDGKDDVPSSNLYKKRYAYNTLNDTEKKFYRSLMKAVENFQPSVEIPSGMSKTDTFKVFIMVYNEEPQLFWMDGAFSTASDTIATIKYKTTKDRIKDMQAEIDANVSPLMAKINAASTDYAKLKLMYDYIVLHNDFCLESTGFNPSIYNAFTSGGELQCAGYAKAVQYLCDLAGIESSVIVGENSGGDSHAWNVVKCDGKYYNLDSTWGDPMNPSNGKITYKKDYIRYTYFLVPDKIIHDISHCKVNQYTTSLGTVKCFNPPACVSDDLNYFKQENLYYSNADSAKKAIKAQIKKAVSSKFQSVQIRVSSEELYNNIMTDKCVIEYQKYAKSLSSDVSAIYTYRTETYKKTGIVTIDIAYK